MDYRSLGNTGLKVSALSYGNMTASWGPDTEQTHFEITEKCIQAGVNFFDTAENSGKGTAESILGKNLKQGGWDRDDLVISTKLSPNFDQFFGNGRKRMRRGLSSSLERLQLNNVDLLFLHRPDSEVPLLEQIRTMNWFIEQDLTYYWGTSEFTPQMIMEIHKLCDKHGFHHPVVEQCEYNMLMRENMELNYVPFFDEWGMGTTVWSPLAMGILSGKYNDGNVLPDSRFANMSELPVLASLYQKYVGWRPDRGAHMLQGLSRLAGELGCSQSQLALAWVIKSQDVSTCILGASSLQQLESNLGALEVSKKLNADIEGRVEELLGNRPLPPVNFRYFQLSEPRRK